MAVFDAKAGLQKLLWQSKFQKNFQTDKFFDTIYGLNGVVLSSWRIKASILSPRVLFCITYIQ